MEKLSSTARMIDVVFRILSIALTVIIAVNLIGLCFLVVGMVFDLPLEETPQLDSGYYIGPFTFRVTGKMDICDFGGLFPYMALPLAAAIAMLISMKIAVKTVRDILKPMTEGQPFHRAVSKNITRLAWLTLIIGVLYQLMQVATQLLSTVLSAVYVSRVNLHVQVEPHFDLGFLALTVLLFLLAYIFRYGEELQTLSDETL